MKNNSLTRALAMIVTREDYFVLPDGREVLQIDWTWVITRRPSIDYQEIAEITMQPPTPENIQRIHDIYARWMEEAGVLSEADPFGDLTEAMD